MSTDSAASNADTTVRTFHVEIAEAAIVDLRRRIAAWRPPEREPVEDQSQGVQLATVQDLARYWATEYDCALNLRSHHPVLIDAGFADLQTPIPWWDGRTLRFRFPPR
jgi:hypothetical protein